MEKPVPFRTAVTDDIGVEVRECVFRQNWKSVVVISNGESTEILDCGFYNLERDGYHLVTFGTQDMIVRGCEFVLWDWHPWPQEHTNFTRALDTMIEDCVFEEGSIGTTVSISSSATIRDCEFVGQSVYGVAAGPQTIVVLDDVGLRDQNRAIGVHSATSVVHGSSCVMEGVQNCSVYVAAAGSIELTECDLANGAQGAVWVEDCEVTPPQHLDFTNNYWGTVNPDSIQAWIHDRNDSDAICRYVDYEPFRSESTPVESLSLSELKALLRGGGK